MNVPVSVIERYLELGVSATDVAGILKVSLRTIRRRMEQSNIRVSNFFSDVEDEHLDTIISDIQQMFPNCGYKMMQGHLQGRGIRVQSVRVQQSMRRIDPDGVLERTLRLNTIRRRVYSVPAPNCLWHMDGNHKLIRWRIVIHGAIDGFSRMVVFLKASNNNRAETVCSYFLEAVHRHGLPSRVRSDKGGENRDVASYMVANRGIDRHSHIAGRSVHNQRIERLWRDVFICVTELFHSLFWHLEGEGLLCPDDETHLFALQWVFLPRIQMHLDFFVQGWNHHGIRTAPNQSPIQLWHRFRNSPDAPELQQVDENYGVDWTGPSDPGEDAAGVQVPEIQLSQQLSQAELNRLPHPDNTEDDYGVHLYLQTVEVLTTLLN